MAKSEKNGRTGGRGPVIAGLVYLVAVAGVYDLIRRHIKELDSQVKEVWLVGKQVARNTSSTWMLEEAATLAEQLRDAVHARGAS